MSLKNLLVAFLALACISSALALPPNDPSRIAAAQSATDCILTWQNVPSPGIGTQGNALLDVSAVSASDVWAVGHWIQDDNDLHRALIQHWDGTQWSIVPEPELAAEQSELNGVVAISSNDVWAVGRVSERYGYNPHPLSLHWDGTTWSNVSVPTLSNGSLRSVSAASANDVWAVGATYNPNSYPTGPLLLHWDGHAWEQVPAPVSAPLVRVIARAADEAWALADGTDATLLRWDGSVWSVHSRFTKPEPSRYFYTTFTDIAVQAPDDIWVVGYRGTSLVSLRDPHVYHWNGAEWAISDSTNPSAVGSLEAVVALGRNRILAAGNFGGAAYFEQWNGSARTIFNFTNYGFGEIYGITAISDDEFWAVGGLNSTNPTILHATLPCRVAPPAPNLTSPPDGAVLSTIRPTFYWTRTAETGYYKFEFSYARPGAIITDGGVVLESAQEPHFAPVDALPDGSFNWRVRACNYAYCSPWSETRTFRIETPPLLTPPEVSSPQEDAILRDSTVVFDYQDEFARSFVAEIYWESLEGPLEERVVTDQQQFKRTLYGGRYVWRVQGCKGDACSPWSSWLTFTVFPEDSPPPLLWSPSDNQLLTTHKPAFEWSPTRGASAYHLELMRDAPDGTLVGQVQIEQVTHLDWSDRLPRGTYFWRLNACVEQYCTAWSDYIRFEIDDAPPVPRLLSPEQEAVAQASDLKLNWSDSARATSYNVQLWRGAVSGKPLVEATTTKSRFAPQLPPERAKYYWRVRACGRVGCSLWSPLREFVLH